MSKNSALDAAQRPSSDFLRSEPLARHVLRIAVIDSGVNLSHPHICATTHGVVLDGDKSASFEDTVGHGTAVMAAIQEKAPSAEYYAVKLFGNTLRSSSAQLIKAIEWSIESGSSIVNLSLGTPNLDYRDEMQKLVWRAQAAGVILVAACNAGANQPVLPGALEGVISVDVDWNLPRDRFRYAGGCFWASGYPRSLPGVPPSRNLNGISFAVANMTGFVANAYESCTSPSYDTVHEKLISQASFSL